MINWNNPYSVSNRVQKSRQRFPLVKSPFDHPFETSAPRFTISTLLNPDFGKGGSPGVGQYELPLYTHENMPAYTIPRAVSPVNARAGDEPSPMSYSPSYASLAKMTNAPVATIGKSSGNAGGNKLKTPGVGQYDILTATSMLTRFPAYTMPYAGRNEVVVPPKPRGGLGRSQSMAGLHGSPSNTHSRSSLGAAGSQVLSPSHSTASLAGKHGGLSRAASTASLPAAGHH